MSHLKYSPVGYDFRADSYCLDCIAGAVRRGREVSTNGGPGECKCTECKLDRAAIRLGIPDRHDEASFDSGDFPKAIPYHNDIHIECGPEGYGYEPGDPEWLLAYCNAVCAICHTPIDGTVTADFETVCPVWYQRKQDNFGREEVTP